MNGGYTRTFDGQKGREWSVLAQHTRNRNVQDYGLDQFRGPQPPKTPPKTTAKAADNLLPQPRNHPPDRLRPTVFGNQLPRNRGQGHSAPREQQLRRGQQPRSGTTLDPQFNPDRSNEFSYDQDVLAGYASYGFSASKKLSFKLGTRVENTRIDGRFQQRQSENSGVKQNYTNVLPNLSLNFQPKNEKKPGEIGAAGLLPPHSAPPDFLPQPLRQRLPIRSTSATATPS